MGIGRQSHGYFLDQLNCFRRQGFELEENLLQLRAAHIDTAQLIDSQGEKPVNV